MLRFVPTIYLALCAAALGIFVMGLPAVAGDDADPLSAVFVYLVSLPWILVLRLIGDHGTGTALAAAVIGMAINYVILRWLLRRLSRTAG